MSNSQRRTGDFIFILVLPSPNKRGAGWGGGAQQQQQRKSAATTAAAAAAARARGNEINTDRRSNALLRANSLYSESLAKVTKVTKGLWNRWEVLVMSINHSQPRIRLRPILLNSRFHRKPTAPLVLGLFDARVLAARLAGYTRSVLQPFTPHLRREFPKRRVSFPFSPLTKTIT